MPRNASTVTSSGLVMPAAASRPAVVRPSCGHNPASQNACHAVARPAGAAATVGSTTPPTLCRPAAPPPPSRLINCGGRVEAEQCPWPIAVTRQQQRDPAAAVGGYTPQQSAAQRVDVAGKAAPADLQVTDAQPAQLR